MSTERIYLRMMTDDSGQRVIVDQHGRRVSGITRVSYDHGVDEANLLTITVMEKNSQGDILSRGRTE